MIAGIKTDHHDGPLRVFSPETADKADRLSTDQLRIELKHQTVFYEPITCGPE